MLNKIYFLACFTILFLTNCNQSEKQLEAFNVAFENSEWQETIELSQSILKNGNCNADVMSKTARAHSQLNQDAASLQLLDKAIECSPETPENYGYRGILKYKMNPNNFESILSDLNIALTEHPSNEQLLRIQALMYFNLGQPNEAIQVSRQLLRVNPNNPDGYTVASRAYEMLQKSDSALKVLKLGLMLVPNNIHLNEDMGYYYLTQESYDTAITYFNQVIATTPQDPLEQNSQALGYNNRGFCLLQLGNEKEALNDINHSIEMFSTNSFAFKNRALVYIAMGEKEKACADLQQANILGFTQYFGNEVNELIATHCN